MAKKLNSVVGIDIGSRKIKVCEIKTQGKEPIVTALGIIDTPEGAVDHGGIYNDEAVAQALKSVLSSSGISTKAVVVSIAGQNSVLVRTLEVPRMNPQELRDHMQWEINRNIPFAESTVVSDFKALGDDDPNSPNMDVVMAIAPQSAIDTTVSCIKRAGAQTAAIDVEPLSMARSVARSYDDELSGKTVCLVDMGASSCAINIYSGSKLLMPRQIPLGGDMFTKAIADDQTLPLGDAEHLKMT
ncbi:type IV pilus assembly protein PilM, partial [bacterium]